MTVDQNSLAEDLFGGSSTPNHSEAVPQKSEADTFAESIYTSMKTEDPQETKPSGLSRKEQGYSHEPISDTDLNTMAEELSFSESDVEFVKANGLSKEQVENIHEFSKADHQHNIDQLGQLSDIWMTESQETFSENELATYAELTGRIADQDVIDLLKFTGLANHPGFIRFINSLAN